MRASYHDVMRNQKKWVTGVVWFVVAGMVLSLVGLAFVSFGN